MAKYKHSNPSLGHFFRRNTTIKDTISLNIPSKILKKYSDVCASTQEPPGKTQSNRMGRRNRKPIIIENLEITGVATKGKGVGRNEEGQVIFVEDVAPGDVVDVRINKKKKGFLSGYAIKYHSLSKDRVEPFCEHYDICGGCQWQHLDYQMQVFHKEKVVREAIARIGKVTPQEFIPILPAEKTTFYRNKLEFAFSNKRWLTKEEIENGTSNLEDVLGFHKAGAFDKILDIEKCWLQNPPSNKVRIIVKNTAIKHGFSFHDPRAHEGMMRNIMIRLTSTNELMLIVTFHENKKKQIKAFLDDILEQLPELTTLYYCINGKLNDYIGDLEMILYDGKGYVEEQLGHVRFKIGPKSFFQTNSYQAKHLYDKVVEFASLSGKENVYDLYTGVGSIALYLAKFCKQVVGIEEIPEAIEDAKENARINDITNCVFYAGDVKNILTKEFADKHGKPDLVITDPPRAGMHEKVVNMFLELAAPKIVYVSCNPATQARDVQLLSAKYDLIKIQPVDMFPHTHHVETVALLQLKE